MRRAGRLLLALALAAAGCQVRSPLPAAASAAPPAAPAEPSTLVDQLTFGDAVAEAAHGLIPFLSEVIRGADGLPARILLPDGATNWAGGRVSFRMTVDAGAVNYATIRLSGSDATQNRLLLLCEGRQVGYRHLGDVDVLDEGNGLAARPGQFIYSTTPIPTNLTAGRTSVVFEIRSNGRVWGYSGSFDGFQRPMTNASRGLYRFYAHTNGYFRPPADERPGRAPAEAPRRSGPGVEVLERVKARVNGDIRKALATRGALSQVQLWFLAQACREPWTLAHANTQAVAKVLVSLDALYLRYQADPAVAHTESSTWNPDWFGVGPAAQAVVLLAAPLKAELDRAAPGAPGLTRRRAWADLFVACRDAHRKGRRWYTNQSMIIDTYGIYLPNRAVALLDPARALPEDQALRYLREAAGLAPWLGAERDGQPTRPLGDDYHLLTRKGLTRELGFVGYYGEVLNWMSDLCEATATGPGAAGDPQLTRALAAAAQARARFRYPATDDEGYRAMRAETVVGWRDQAHYPGDVTYLQRPGTDGSPLQAAAVSRDPALVGACRQALEDGQLFASIERQVEEPGLRTTIALLQVPAHFDRLTTLPAATNRLPMTEGQPDFAWADEEDGVVAIKHRGEILYASLYWRARYAVNFHARVHHIAPQFDRIATVREEVEVEPSGLTYKRPDWTSWGFGNGGPRCPDGVHSAHAGEELPVALMPAGVTYVPGADNVYAGRGSLYRLRYGPYFIAMNCTTGRTFSVEVPVDLRAEADLVTGRPAAGASTWTLSPLTTLVLKREDR